MGIFKSIGKAFGAIAAIAVAFIPGVGPALTGFLTTGLGIGATAAGAIVGGIASMGVMSALGIATKALGLGPTPPKLSPAMSDRLFASINPQAARKIVLGRTAMATDVHYQEYSGDSQEYLWSVITAASHAVQSIDELWFENRRVWTSSAGVVSDLADYLTVTAITAGTAGNAMTVGTSGSWTAANARMLGLAYLVVRYKLKGNSDSSNSPYASSVPTRVTIRGKGAKLYDPRLDSTVAGGSGSHRATDQTTWGWPSDNVGRNPALQLLFYLLGWKINGKLAVGLGIPGSRIDLPSFIAAANICDQSVTLADGGTEPRYRCDGVVSEDDDPGEVQRNLLAAMNGALRDAGGKISLSILYDDLASSLDLTAADVVGSFVWMQTPPIDQYFNIVRGRYTDPSDAGLYNLVDYPEVGTTSLDGLERVQPFDLAMVQSPTQAQRLAKLFLMRAQYPGTFTAEFLASAWRCTVGSVVRFTFPALGFSNKLFRVVEHTIRLDGICQLVMREESSAIYSWSSAEEKAVVVPVPTTTYNPLNDPLLSSTTRTNFLQATAPSIAESGIGDRWVDTDDNKREYQRIGTISYGADEVTYGGTAVEIPWMLVGDQRVDQALDDAATAQTTAAGKNKTFNSETEPTPEAIGDYWYQDSTKRTWRWNGATWDEQATNGAPSGTPVGSSTADMVASAAGNFNARNDRDGSAIAAATIATDGTAVDHAITSNGVGADISFEWAWGGVEAGIDGFEVLVRASTSASAYTVGAAPAEERVERVPASRRALILHNASPSLYYTFAVRAYRIVDPDIATGGVIYGSWVKATGSGENPYQPASSTPYSGNVTGTVGGTAASIVAGGSSAAVLGLNTDGTVQDDKVSTPSIVVNSVNYTFFGTLVGDYTQSNGVTTTVITLNVTGVEIGDLLRAVAMIRLDSTNDLRGSITISYTPPGGSETTLQYSYTMLKGDGSSALRINMPVIGRLVASSAGTWVFKLKFMQDLSGSIITVKDGTDLEVTRQRR